MGRNRKNGSSGRFVPAVQAALVCVLLGGAAIGYVYQKNQIIELGKRIQEREKRLAGLKASNATLLQQLQTLQSPFYLKQKVKQLNLDLVQPAQSQLLTILEVPASLTTRSEPPSVERPVGPIALKKFAAAR